MSTSKSKATPETRCGFIALVGLPNAGKSTLMNHIVGAKVSIISKKPQTTRNRILGIAIEDKTQMVFVDTPGIFKAKKALERAMVGAAMESIAEADIVVHIVDASRKNIADINGPIIQRLEHDKPKRCYLVLNKIDQMARQDLLARATEMNAVYDYDQTFMISGLKGDGVQTLVDDFAETLPNDVWHYDEDEITDMPMRMMAAEMTREQIFNQLHEELPYDMYVQTEEWEEFDNGSVKISQVITVQKDSQKAIVLGKGGARIKSLGQAAREELEEFLERRVHLKLFVKVQKNWADGAEIYQLMGLQRPS